MKQIFHHGLLLIAFVFGLFFQMAAQSTQMIVTLNSGEEKTFLMMEDDRVYFEDNVKLVIEQGVYAKEITRIALADIRKIVCRETEGTSENAELALGIYPNPVHDVLTFRNLQGKQIVCIHALDGRMVKTFEASGDQAVDISELPIGVYLVATPTQTLKMIKL